MFKGSGECKIIEKLYQGTAKSGPYLAGMVELRDGQYGFRAPIFATADAVPVMSRAEMGDSFLIAGYLVENMRKKGDEKIRTLQIKVTHAKPAGAPETNGFADQPTF